MELRAEDITSRRNDVLIEYMNITEIKIGPTYGSHLTSNEYRVAWTNRMDEVLY
jgi:hypothetical protein